MKNITVIAIMLCTLSGGLNIGRYVESVKNPIVVNVSTEKTSNQIYNCKIIGDDNITVMERFTITPVQVIEQEKDDLVGINGNQIAVPLWNTKNKGELMGILKNKKIVYCNLEEK